MAQRKHSDMFLEKKWNELADVPFAEGDMTNLSLEHDWWLFNKGTNRETIWHYFDKTIPKEWRGYYMTTK